MKRNLFLTYIVLSFFVMLFLISCTSTVEVQRNVRIKFDKTIYMLPYTRAEKNIGFIRPGFDEDDQMIKIDDELEDLLYESIFIFFKKQNFFKNVLKVNNKSQVPSNSNGLLFYLKNKFISLNKKVLSYKAKIKSLVVIKDINGKIVFKKHYFVKEDSGWPNVNLVTKYLYKKFIRELVNDLEMHIGGLPQYSERSETEQQQRNNLNLPHRRGEFWM